MREFFHGWKRKAGCVTLVMACVFMGGWVRSEFKEDGIDRGDGDSAYIVASTSRSLYWVRFLHIQSGTYLHLRSQAASNHLPFGYGGVAPDDISGIEGAGFEFSVWDFGKSLGFGRKLIVWKIPYWPIVLPLTLVSAYLLLGQPRLPAPKTTEPAPAIGP